MRWEVSINVDGGIAVVIPESVAINSYLAKSIFVPSKEVVSFYEGLGGLLREYKIKLDSTYMDMVENFDFPEAKILPALSIAEQIESIINGKLELENRRLIFVGKNGEEIEVSLLAEGLRKLAMLPYFVRHGLIQGTGETIFWDEPEANLNAKLIVKLAEALVVLARHNVQIILATHSLLFLKEIDLQLQLLVEQGTPVPARFFALSLKDDGVKITTGDVLEEVDPIVALDMEIDQADRYRDWYYRVSRAE